MQNNNSNIGYTSKYDEMLKQYNLDITDEEVKAAVKKIIEEKVAENNNVEVKKFLLGSVELTTLQDHRHRRRSARNGRESEQICTGIPYSSTRWSCLCLSDCSVCRFNALRDG